MDLSTKIEEEEIKKLSSKIPVVSEYGTALERHVKLRYLKKISVLGIDPFIIPCEEFDPECLPPIEQSDLFGYLVLQTSYYTNDQFKNYRSLEAYNQVVSGFVASVGGRIISGKYVVAAKVGTFRSEYEYDYEYEFSVLSTRIRFRGRHFSKCACSERKTRTPI